LDATPLQSYSSGIYESGVLKKCSTTKLNHWMVVVGYGTDVKSKKPYWKVKNSWGSSWGVEGYLFIIRNTTDGPGECGLQTSMYYPVD
jgi:cathepsin L